MRMPDKIEPAMFEPCGMNCMGCSNCHMEKDTLRKVFIQAWNTLLENREKR